MDNLLNDLTQMKKEEANFKSEGVIIGTTILHVTVALSSVTRLRISTTFYSWHGSVLLPYLKSGSSSH